MRQVDQFSRDYVVRKLTEDDIESVYELCQQNTIYYEYCPPFITREGVRADMEGLPPGKSMEDKYYVGYYKEERLIAVLDLIDGYPKEEIAFIGFFMTDVLVQKKGVGTTIISALCDYLKTIDFKAVQLAWVKGNSQAEGFWLKNQFQIVRESSSNVAQAVIVGERKLGEVEDGAEETSGIKKRS